MVTGRDRGKQIISDKLPLNLSFNLSTVALGRASEGLAMNKKEKKNSWLQEPHWSKKLNISFQSHLTESKIIILLNILMYDKIHYK